MLLTNPKINGSTTSVQAIINGIPKTNPAQYLVHGTITIPTWTGIHGFSYHYQGIAPYNGSGGPTIANGCISASSTSGYFSGFSQAQGSNPTVKSVVIPNSSYYHLAGIQMLGDVLAAPLEGEDVNAYVAFYNVGNLAAPVFLYNLDMPGKKASAVGICTYKDSSGVETAMLVVYEYDHRYMYIYTAPAGAIGGTSSPWTLQTTYQGTALQGDQFQCFSLVTQSNSSGDVVYLAGFREDEELHLYTVNTVSGSSFGNLTAVQVWTGWGGSDWRNGVGLQIASSTVLRIFGTEEDPNGNPAGNTSNYTSTSSCGVDASVHLRDVKKSICRTSRATPQRDLTVHLLR